MSVGGGYYHRRYFDLAWTDNLAVGDLNSGDWIPFVLGAGLCAAAFAAARPASDHVGAAVVVDRLPGDAAGVRGK